MTVSTEFWSASLGSPSITASALNSVASGGAGVLIGDIDTTSNGATCGRVVLDLASAAFTGAGASIQLRFHNGTGYCDGPSVTWTGSTVAGTGPKRICFEGRIPGRGRYGMYFLHSLGTATASSGNSGAATLYAGGADTV